MERNRRDHVELAKVYFMGFKEGINQPGEMMAQGGFVPVFVQVDEFFHGIIIKSNRPSTIEMRFLFQTIRAKNERWLWEMAGTGEAKGRIILSDGILTAGTKTGFFFKIGKISGAEDTVTRKKKIKKIVEKSFEHRGYIIMDEIRCQFVDLCYLRIFPTIISLGIKRVSKIVLSGARGQRIIFQHWKGKIIKGIVPVQVFTELP